MIEIIKYDPCEVYNYLYCNWCKNILKYTLSSLEVRYSEYWYLSGKRVPNYCVECPECQTISVVCKK